MVRSILVPAGLLAGVLTGPMLLAGPAVAQDDATRRKGATSRPAPQAAEGTDLAPNERVIPVDRSSRRVIADAQTLVFQASDAPPGAKTLSDIDAREAEIIRQINRKRGTYQSYLLYTMDDLPTRLFHPGFIITLPPPRKRVDPVPVAAPEPAAAPAAPTPESR